MAYTYEDFTKRAQGEGLLEQFSQEELTTAQKSPEYGLALLSIKKDLASATTDEQKLLANEAANQLRLAYGVSSTPTSAGSDGFVYSREDDYKKVFDSLTDPEGFTYDHTQDPTFSAYKKAQLREADRSMRDTLATASSATGGVPSSYAVSAAQQARDYEASKIGDIIPSLYNAAYGQRQDALALLQQDRENAYAEYLARQAAQMEAQPDTVPVDKSETSEIPASYLEMLKQRAPDGVVEDDLWNYMVGMFGEDALKSAGYVNGSPAENVIPSSYLQMLEQRAPDGVVQEGLWNYMVGLFGEDALKSAGYSKMYSYAEVEADVRQFAAGGVSQQELAQYLEQAVALGYINRNQAAGLKETYKTITNDYSAF